MQIQNTGGACDGLVAGFVILGILNNQCMEEFLFYGVGMAAQVVKISATVTKDVDVQQIQFCKLTLQNKYFQNQPKIENNIFSCEYQQVIYRTFYIKKCDINMKKTYLKSQHTNFKYISCVVFDEQKSNQNYHKKRNQHRKHSKTY
eukprot:TRINITY_DN6297_c1_g2_i3.p5 TRINITY_DN6297_c1_g2~~TRINITY_DN6297_c1_g2_i3.p5  ORF type:complete len:146 (-),score=8.24 TRINITY_DN6297_c1_g2_i3:12-449(-)